MYATVNDMIARFGETHILRLSNPEDRTAEAVDVARVERALSDATAEIEGYLRGYYAVPVTAPPVDLVRAASILARYELAQGEHVSPSEEMSKGRDDVLKWLRDIAARRVHLDAPLAEGATGAKVGSGPRYSDRPRDFTYDTLRGA
ncbi:gp436 family protein [Martelella endophytica]|uniref:Mu-like prophage protein gp36 n=1 Tax=Martelella endophytica TaxID=1486262 RepID=A0A0D5LQK0_MAREN|nr:DUF1320 domain-containing protein [Martelella endophytica]AJY46484.1 hypothetical protein TM49_13630 [Martelella endophytica]